MDKDNTKRKIIYPIAVYLLVIVLPAVVASILYYSFPEGPLYGWGIEFYFMGLLLFPLVLIPYGWKTQDKRTSALGSIVGWIGYSPLYCLIIHGGSAFVALWLFSFLVPIPGVFVGRAAAERDKTLTAWMALVYVAVCVLELFFGARLWTD
jgi:hypothetical protein